MPAMRKNFAKELKTAFDRDLAKSKKSKKRLLLENDRITAGHLERRALDYRAQMEAHIKQMEKEGALDEEIQAMVDASKKMFRMFLGEKM